MLDHNAIHTYVVTVSASSQENKNRLLKKSSLDYFILFFSRKVCTWCRLGARRPCRKGKLPPSRSARLRVLNLPSEFRLLAILVYCGDRLYDIVSKKKKKKTHNSHY